MACTEPFVCIRSATILAFGKAFLTALMAGVESRVSPMAVDETTRMFLTSSGLKRPALFDLRSVDLRANT